MCKDTHLSFIYTQEYPIAKEPHRLAHGWREPCLGQYTGCTILTQKICAKFL